MEDVWEQAVLLAPPGGRGSSAPSAKGYSLSNSATLTGQNVHLHHHQKCRLFFCLKSRIFFLFLPPTHTDVFPTSHLAPLDLPQPACCCFVLGPCSYKDITPFLFSGEAHLLSQTLLLFACRLQGCRLLYFPLLQLLPHLGVCISCFHPTHYTTMALSATSP